MSWFIGIAEEKPKTDSVFRIAATPALPGSLQMKKDFLSTVTWRVQIGEWGTMNRYERWASADYADDTNCEKIQREKNLFFTQLQYPIGYGILSYK